MKKNILWFILGGIIFSSITATAAYVYTARDIGYSPSDENWNVTNANDALTSLKDDLNTITNKVEGIERVYKAGEVELVALVADDSFYKDSNDKYVLSNSDTGRTLLADTSTYKSLSSTDDCLGIFDADTVIPFKIGSTPEFYTENYASGECYWNSTNIYSATKNITLEKGTYLVIVSGAGAWNGGSSSLTVTNGIATLIKERTYSGVATSSPQEPRYARGSVAIYLVTMTSDGSATGTFGKCGFATSIAVEALKIS